MVSLKPTRFFLQNLSVLFLSFCFPFFCPFPFVSFFSFSLSLSFLFSFLFRFFLFPLPFSLLFLSFLFPLPFPFLFLFLSLPFSFSFSFLFLSLSFSFNPGPKYITDASTWRNQHSWSSTWGIAIWKGPIAKLSFLHFMKTNVQRIHILVFGSFNDCSNIDVASMLAPLKHWLIHIPQRMLSRYPHLKKTGCNETPAY